MQIPIIATGSVYQTYLDAARTNLENLHRLAVGLNDKEATDEAQSLLDAFDDYAIGLNGMIDEANANAGDFDASEGFWRESVYAKRAGLGA